MGLRKTTSEPLLREILEVDGVAAAAVCSSDGLLLEGHGAAIDLDALAALGTHALDAAARLAAVNGGDAPTSVTLASSETAIVLRPLAQDANIIVLLKRPGNGAYVSMLIDRARRGHGAEG